MANEGNALVAGSISTVPAFTDRKGKEEIMNEFQKQIDVFKDENLDFLLGEVNMFFYLHSVCRMSQACFKLSINYF